MMMIMMLMLLLMMMMMMLIDDDDDDDDVDVVVVDDDDVFVYCILQMVNFFLEMPGRCPPDDVTSKRGRASRTSPVQSCH